MLKLPPIRYPSLPHPIQSLLHISKSLPTDFINRRDFYHAWSNGACLNQECSAGSTAEINYTSAINWRRLGPARPRSARRIPCLRLIPPGLRAGRMTHSTGAPLPAPPTMHDCPCAAPLPPPSPHTVSASPERGNHHHHRHHHQLIAMRV